MSPIFIENYSMHSKTILEIGEQPLLQLIRRRWGKVHSDLPVGMGDDAAVIKTDPQQYSLATCDLLIEDIHFKRTWITPYQLGYKALAVNLSDIAAMGGVPRFALISLAIPGHLPLSWIEDFYKGIDDLAQQWKVIIAGGDTCSSPKTIIINISLLGEVSTNDLLLRSGAKTGDKILVTGTLGEAAAGLSLLQSNKAKAEDSVLIQKQLQPQPRCQEARIISSLNLASAMLDLSDGLATDLQNLARMSQIGLKIWMDKIPVSEYLKERASSMGKNAFELALCGGEDYELLLTAPPHATDPLQKALANINCSLTEIGEILPSTEGLQLIDFQNQPQPWPKGYQHFTNNKN